eukprot:gnl/MRDRNA2_/MRDRNA2_85214_c0_seq2.p1 gnl/MRDRNA2_/MRDRNA2_85214_c0~~gnl/MRDRNA2_/MRDRNA2_85214_c0_seq2.p1  ORF type:complete len:110 (+),score=11.37 gnl/MRDRNA2_/MRDRNA2_85214_c0_seq2:471-800(+)
MLYVDPLIHAISAPALKTLAARTYGASGSQAEQLPDSRRSVSAAVWRELLASFAMFAMRVAVVAVLAGWCRLGRIMDARGQVLMHASMQHSTAHCLECGDAVPLPVIAV